MKKAFLLPVLMLFTLCLAGVVTATTVDIQPVNQTSYSIYFDETAEYDVTITNTAEASKVFTISVNPLQWVVDSKRSVSVESGETKTTSLKIRPRPSNYKGPGVYRIPVEVKTTSDELFQENIKIVIKSIEDRLFEYKPSVAMGMSFAEEIKPKDDLTIQLSVRNRNLRDIDSAQLKLTAPHFSREREFSLTGLEEKTFEFRIDLDDTTEPGSYELNAELLYGDQKLNNVERIYDIIAYADVNRERAESTSSFLKKTSMTQLTNNGNVNKEIISDLDISLIEDIVASVTIDAETYDKVSRHSWMIDISPGETVTVTVEHNYRYLTLIIVFAIAGVIAYLLIRPALTLKKQVIVTGKDSEGVSEMKVRIYLKNRSAKPFYNVRLLDKAPSIAHVDGSSSIGTISPSKIVKTEGKGTIVKWDFDSIEAFDERIVTYTIRARLKIIGTLGLPKAKVRYENAKGKMRNVVSGKAIIGGTS